MRMNESTHSGRMGIHHEESETHLKRLVRLIELDAVAGVARYQVSSLLRGVGVPCSLLIVLDTCTWSRWREECIHVYRKKVVATDHCYFSSDEEWYGYPKTLLADWTDFPSQRPSPLLSLASSLIFSSSTRSHTTHQHKHL